MKKILVLYAILMLLSCNSDDSKPMPTGSDTFMFSFDNTKYSTKIDNTQFNKIGYDIYPNYTWIYIELIHNDYLVSLSLSSNLGTGLEEGKTYKINSYLNSNFIARNEFYSSKTPYSVCYTNSEIGGEITIVKLDYENRIFAANFSYDAVDENGILHTIRDGWFDLKF